MKTRIEKKDKSFRRKARVTFKVNRNAESHKLYVYRSNKHIYAQILDNTGKTVIGVSSSSLENSKDAKQKKPAGKLDISFQAGKEIARLAKENKITNVVFNRGPYKFHGRVKALARGANEGGLKF